MSLKATDVAYKVLQEHGQPMDVQDLLDETLTQLGLDREPRQVAHIYTDINLDVRFLHRGKSQWGLKEWQPKSSGKGSGSSARDRGTFADDSEDSEEDDG